jgi:peptide/nickel transport system permease protein
VLDVLAVGLLAIVILCAIFAPLLAGHSPTGGDILSQFEPPSGSHLLGTDENGNDIFARLLYGARPSLFGPIAVVALALLVGVPMALLAVWRGGLTDIVVGRVLDIAFAFPSVLIASILVLLSGGAGLVPAIIAVAISYIPWAARVTRTAALRERRKPYILACEIQGMSAPAIAIRHLLPNLSRLIIAQATIALGYALVDLAALSFLGLGVRPPTADWGQMVGDTAGFAQGNYTTPVSAAICIVLVVGSIAYLGSRIAGRESDA